VVRDKKGRPVRDLQASDFEVFEDGIKQDLNSFRLVASKSEGGSSIGNSRGEDREKASDLGVLSPNKSHSGAEAGSGTTAVALVFDRLSPDARTRAREAALSYLGESVNKNELMGVFLTDLSLLVLQPFTDNKQLVKLAIEKAGLHSPSLYTSNN
jgi:VWFA-related protein